MSRYLAPSFRSSVTARTATRVRLAGVAAGLFLTGTLVLGQAAAPAVDNALKVDKTVKVAPGLYEIVSSPSTKLVYVASTGSRQATPPVTAKILGIDPVSLEVKQTIDVAEEPAFGLGLNDKTQTLYTTNTRSGSVSAIDLKTQKVVGTIKSEADPKAHLFRLLVDEANNVIYASVTGGRVWVIDGKTNTLAHVIENVGKTTVGLALDAAGKRLFAANIGSGDIAVIDLATRAVTTRFPVPGEGPTMLAYDAKSKRLFVTKQQTGDLSVLDAATGAVVKSLPTGEGALGLGLDETKQRAYVANRQSGTITVIDTAKLEVIANLDAGSRPNTVTIDAKSHHVYVTNKAKSAGRNAPPVDDPAGDTVSLIRS